MLVCWCTKCCVLQCIYWRGTWEVQIWGKQACISFVSTQIYRVCCLTTTVIRTSRAAIMWLGIVYDTASAIVASFSVWHVYVSLLGEHSIMTFYKCLAFANQPVCRASREPRLMIATSLIVWWPVPVDMATYQILRISASLVKSIWSPICHGNLLNRPRIQAWMVQQNGH